MFPGAEQSTWVILVLVGCLSGFASGMLGIGGGTIIVPAMVFSLPLLGIGGPELPKIAMATSLALVIPTAIASAQAHASRGAVDWGLLLLITPALMGGAFITSLFAAYVPAVLLVLLFCGFAYYSAWKLLQPKHAILETGTEAPGILLLVKMFGGGSLSSLIGFGAGYFAIPVLSRHIPMQRAIGTAAALAIPMASAGVAGYFYAGAPEGCPGCTGYIFFPAVAAVGISAVLVAPLGAWAAHAVSVVALKRIFAVFLIFAASSMLYKSISASGVAAMNPQGWVTAAVDVVRHWGSSPVAAQSGGAKNLPAQPVAPDATNATAAKDASRLPAGSKRTPPVALTTSVAPSPGLTIAPAPVGKPGASAPVAAPVAPAPVAAPVAPAPVVAAVSPVEPVPMAVSPDAPLPYQIVSPAPGTPPKQPVAAPVATVQAPVPEMRPAQRRPSRAGLANEDRPALAISLFTQIHFVPTLPRPQFSVSVKATKEVALREAQAAKDQATANPAAAPSAPVAAGLAPAPEQKDASATDATRKRPARHARNARRTGNRSTGGGAGRRQ